MWGLEYFRYYVYGKRVNLLTDHQALQPLLKRNRASKQYSARLTRWLDRLSQFDVNTPLAKHFADRLFKRYSIVSVAKNGTENSNRKLEAEAGEEFGINQKHGLFDFIQTNGSRKKFAERNKRKQKIDQSQPVAHTREQNEKVHSFEASTSSNGVNSTSPKNF